MSITVEAQKILEHLIMEDEKNPVKVALFGQPGAGKSSIVNKLVGKKVAKVSPRTDTTQSSSDYQMEDKQEFASNSMLIVDLPGYGTSKFPKEGYYDNFALDEIDLFLCVFSGKFHSSDTELFNLLKAKGKQCIFIRNKSDDIWDDDENIDKLYQTIIDDLRSQIKSNEQVIFTSCRNGNGFEELNEAIYRSLDITKKEKWVRSAKAYSIAFLEEKKKACEKLVILFSGLSAVNGINPIPGADVAVNVAIILKMFSKIKEYFGLDDRALDNIVKTVPFILQAANNVINYAQKQGVILLLQKYIGQYVVQDFAKYIPLVGQAAAASSGFALSYSSGKFYLNECYDVAKAILENELVRSKK
ncbi:hypothetical protein GJ688_17895 [Heliobacillus mobilis]|uniref:IRG-type G domain-containing protein n=1 Tax=Heliobacterium mobile TaxID=28064 RepID=A0A6I3SRX9_HELMO|nr:GTPase [Heliobacterium mobile]MTV50807.1 hypothetical protein [Heliobacterium mobile]